MRALRVPPAVLALRAIVSLLIATSCYGLWTMATDRPGILAQFPGADSPLYELMFASGALGLIAAIGLLRLRRWAVALYAVVVAAMLAMDEAAEAPRAHQAAVAIGATLVMLCSWLARAHFKPRRHR